MLKVKNVMTILHELLNPAGTREGLKQNESKDTDECENGNEIARWSEEDIIPFICYYHVKECRIVWDTVNGQ